ncbi:MAG: CAP domain-containing protein [Planctomycetota bacterium]|nr:MAG: CAP domain-containing protein [Planctomycetota bacterium]
MKNYVLAIIIVVGLIIWMPGCSKSHKSSRNSIPASGGSTGGTGGTVPGGTGTGSGNIPGGSPGTGTGSGTGGGTGTGDTVPGNTQIGLAENPEAPRIPGGTADEQMVAQAINEYRQQNGLPALIWSDEIADAERSHAYDCEQQGYFGHGAKSNPSNYSFCTQRGQFLGLPGSLYECGYGGGASGALTAWKNSSTHRAAILNSTLKYHGVGIGASGVAVFWASLR